MQVKTPWVTKVARDDTGRQEAIQLAMKQPTDQRERNEDKKNPEENPSRGIDPPNDNQGEPVHAASPRSKEPETLTPEKPASGLERSDRNEEERMEVVDQDPGSPTRAFFARGGVEDPGHRQKENQNQKKDDDLAA